MELTPNTSASSVAFSLTGRVFDADAARAIAKAPGVPHSLETALVGLIHLVETGADDSQLKPFDDAACCGARGLHDCAHALALARALVERLQADLSATVKIEHARARDELARFESLETS